MVNSTAIDKMKSFYKKCKVVTSAMNSNNTLPEIKNGSVVKAVLDEFKTLTNYTFNLCDTSSQNTNNDSQILAKALAFLSIKYGVDTLVTPFVDVNAERNDAFAANFTLYIDQNTVTYAKPYYQSGAWTSYTRTELTKNARMLVKNFAASVNMTCKTDSLNKNIDDIVKLEYLLATNFSTDDDTRRNFSRWINPMKVRDIPYKFVDWATYISQLSNYTGVPFVNTTTVNDYLLLIAEPDMIQSLTNYLPMLGIDRVVKYLYYRLLLSQKQFVYTPSGTSYTALYYQSGYSLGEKNKKQDPYISKVTVDDAAISCAAETQDYMQYANARVFTEALYKSPDAREYIRKLVLMRNINLKNKL